MLEESLLKQAFAECGAQLGRIIAALQRKDLAKTYAYYSNGSVVEYDIVGALNQNVINKTDLVKVEIGNTVTSIGNYAFSGCSRLTSITIPDSVTSIGNLTFYGCSGLTLLTIPNGVTSIGDSAFYECSQLTSVTIPDAVTSIGDSAFSGCSGLTSITIGEGVMSIRYNAFYSTSIMNTYMTTKSSVEVQAMNDYPWGLPAGGIIHCFNADIVVPESGGSGS